MRITPRISTGPSNGCNNISDLPNGPWEAVRVTRLVQPTRAIVIADGELTEERLTWGASTAPVRYRRFETFDFGPTDIHRVYHSGAEPSTAIHVFSPPLRGLGSYERGKRGVLLRHPLGPLDEVKPLPSDR